MSFFVLPRNAPQASDAPKAPAASEVCDASVVSGGGVFAASEEEKKLLCLLSDGRLLVAEGQSLNPHVLSYQARLEKMNRPFQVVSARIEAIRRAYRNTLSEKTEQHARHSAMQLSAKDLLNKACDARASDIHIRVKADSTEILFRVHNDLVLAGSQTREHGERLMATLYGAMASVSDNAYKPMERQDAAISDRDKLPPRLYGVRIATAPTSEGALMVLRLLYNDAGDNVDLRPLGFSDTHAALLQRLKEQPSGMNIISGPTGSGKSTTLQRVLVGELREAGGKLHVLTVEDPVEYPIEGAVQTAVTNASTEAERARQFAAAISNAMRLDPDVIMIGEMRDGASAQNALRASMTGHQVWTTVHANSALAVVDRLLDLGLPMSLVADPAIVTGLISQRLVKLLCPHCSQPLAMQAEALAPAAHERLSRALGAALARVRVAGPGCEHCRHQGTIGRTVLAEVIVPDDQFFRYVRAGDKAAATAYWLEALGGQTIRAHALEKIAAGLVDPRMAEKVVGHLAPAAGAARPLQEAIRAVG